MATDNAIQNQKVFVKLSGVLELQADYHQIIADQQLGDKDPDTMDELAARRAGIESAITTLELPISLTQFKVTREGGVQR